MAHSYAEIAVYTMATSTKCLISLLSLLSPSNAANGESPMTCCFVNSTSGKEIINLRRSDSREKENLERIRIWRSAEAVNNSVVFYSDEHKKWYVFDKHRLIRKVVSKLDETKDNAVCFFAEDELWYRYDNPDSEFLQFLPICPVFDFKQLFENRERESIKQRRVEQFLRAMLKDMENAREINKSDLVYKCDMRKGWFVRDELANTMKLILCRLDSKDLAQDCLPIFRAEDGKWYKCIEPPDMFLKQYPKFPIYNDSLADFVPIKEKRFNTADMMFQFGRCIEPLFDDHGNVVQANPDRPRELHLIARTEFINSWFVRDETGRLRTARFTIDRDLTKNTNGTVYFRAEDAKWYKCRDPKSVSPKFEWFITNLPEFDGGLKYKRIELLDEALNLSRRVSDDPKYQEPAIVVLSARRQSSYGYGYNERPYQDGSNRSKVNRNEYEKVYNELTKEKKYDLGNDFNNLANNTGFQKVMEGLKKKSKHADNSSYLDEQSRDFIKMCWEMFPQKNGSANPMRVDLPYTNSSTAKSRNTPGYAKEVYYLNIYEGDFDNTFYVEDDNDDRRKIEYRLDDKRQGEHKDMVFFRADDAKWYRILKPHWRIREGIEVLPPHSGQGELDTGVDVAYESKKDPIVKLHDKGFTYPIFDEHGRRM